jgi:hypothetical protein
MNINSQAGVYLRCDDVLIFFGVDNYKSACRDLLEFNYKRSKLNNYNSLGDKSITSFIDKRIKRK